MHCRAGSIVVQVVQVHRAPHLNGSMLGFMLCCHCLTICNTVSTKGTLHFHFALSPMNYVADPASNPFLFSVL